MAIFRSITPKSAFPPSVLGRLLLLGALFSCLLGSGRAQEELPLPQWTEEELRAFREQNIHAPSLEALLPEPSGLAENLDEVLRGPLKSGPRLDDLPERLTGELQPRLTLEHMRSFLPESEQTSHEEIRNAQPVDSTAPTAIAALRSISPEFMKAAAGMPGDLYFIDPDSRVPEMAAMELTRLLEFHARDARIRLYVLILGKNETLPADAAVEKVASGRLVTTNACLLTYPVGEPWRARLFVSETVHALTSASFLSETSAECVKQAMHASEAHDQIERYVVTLSTRLFWLQKAIGSDLRHEAHQVALRELTEGGAPRVATADPILPSKDASSPSWAWWSLGIVTSTCGGAWAGLRWHRQRRRRLKSSIWELPEPETSPRLGGAFCGGGGAMIKFG